MDVSLASRGAPAASRPAAPAGRANVPGVRSDASADGDFHTLKDILSGIAILAFGIGVCLWCLGLAP